MLIGNAVRTGSSSYVVTDQVTLYSLAPNQLPLSVSVEFVIGPGAIQLGLRNACRQTVSASPTTTRPSCVATNNVFTVIGGTQNITIVTEYSYAVDQATTITQTTTNFEQYTLTGIVRRIGSVHPLGVQAAGDAADLFARRLREVGDAGELRQGLWLAGYGWFGQRGKQGEIAADRRAGEGVTGGAAIVLGEQAMLGVGFDAGRTHLTLPLVGERATIDLTQLGAHFAWRANDWALRASGSFGWGNIATLTTPSDLNFSTSARSRVRTATLSAEIAHQFASRGWTLTPAIGAQWQRTTSDAFAEPGVFGLYSGPATIRAGKAWVGATIARAASSALPVRFKSYARVTARSGDRVSLPAAFTGSTTTVSLDSPDLGSIGAEAGVAVNLSLGSAVTASAGYDARIRSSFALHTITAGLRISL